MKMLLNYPWPGNIRELQNVLERAMALATSKYINLEALPEEIIKREEESLPQIDVTKPYKEVCEAAKKNLLIPFQQEYLVKILTETRGNVSEAARRAGLHRVTFQYLLKEHGLSSKDFRSPSGK